MSENSRYAEEITLTEQNLFFQGVKDCLPTLLGYVSIGIACGVVASTAGLSLMEISLFCLLLYAGSAQFIVAGMIASGSSIAAITLTVFFVNARHLLLSAALSPYLKNLSPLKNAMIGCLISDETFGVAAHKAFQTGRLSEKWMHGLNITAFIGWWLANVGGAFLGQWITDPEKYGLDFALTGMFIGLLILSAWGRKKFKLDIAVGMIAVVVAVASTLFLSSSLGIILGTVVGATIGMVIERWK
ncbi:branched-chain amino acid ABC transporter permease [Paenibacillaceae bacterium]|nr:branched-chain amino acid ABC transporter permease [Paenibacillaceae bacterium]